MTTTTETLGISTMPAWKRDAIWAARMARVTQDELECKRLAAEDEDAAIRLTIWRNKYSTELLRIGITGADLSVSVADQAHPTIYLDGCEFFKSGDMIYMKHRCLECEVATNVPIRSTIELGWAILDSTNYLCWSCSDEKARLEAGELK